MNISKSFFSNSLFKLLIIKKIGENKYIFLSLIWKSSIDKSFSEISSISSFWKMSLLFRSLNLSFIFILSFINLNILSFLSLFNFMSFSFSFIFWFISELAVVFSLSLQLFVFFSRFLEENFVSHCFCLFSGDIYWYNSSILVNKLVISLFDNTSLFIKLSISFSSIVSILSFNSLLLLNEQALK